MYFLIPLSAEAVHSALNDPCCGCELPLDQCPCEVSVEERACEYAQAIANTNVMLEDVFARGLAALRATRHAQESAARAGGCRYCGHNGGHHLHCRWCRPERAQDRWNVRR